jgi:hypothetical protein
MSPLISIDPDQVTILNPNEFAALCSDLIVAEGQKVGIPIPRIHTNLLISAPDGGIDCRIEDSAGSPTAAAGGWIPHGISVWQFKAGECPPARELAKGEFSKPGVVSALDAGDTYVFVTAAMLTALKLTEIEATLAGLYAAHGHVDAHGRVVDANKLAGWASEYLAIAAKYIHVPLGDWQSFRQWATVPTFQNPFVFDEQRTDLVARLRHTVDGGEKFAVIEGAAGAGKTRLVLEALSRATDSDRVLYLRDADRLDYDLQRYLQIHKGGTGILVVDEVTTSRLDEVRNYGHGLPQGYTLIAISPLEGRPRPASLQLGPLGIEQLSEIIEYFAPQLSLDARRAIAARCGGSPKLVEVIAQRIVASGPGSRLRWEEIEQDPDVAHFIDRLYPSKDEDIVSKVLRSVALFSKLGWQDEVQGEALAIWGFLRLEPTEARLAVLTLAERHGVISRRGRYLYVTPDILANHLSRGTLEAVGAGVKDLLACLPAPAQAAFVERLAQLGGNEDTASAVTGSLEDSRFFASLEELNEPGKAKFLQALSMAFPEYVLAKLESVILEATGSQLLELRQGRREVVWSLEALAWHSEHFSRAARLLRLLATQENESYANNATGVWKALFQVVLSGTEVEYAIRAGLLDEALSDPDPRVRILGIRALDASLATTHIARFGLAPSSGPILPPKEWRPDSYKEWADIVAGNLAKLAGRLEDPIQEVRDLAMKVFVEHARDLFRVGYGEVWLDIARGNTGAPYGVRKLLHDALVNVQAYEAESVRDLMSAVKEVTRGLAGTSDEDRIKGIIGSWPYQAALVEGSRGPTDDQISGLAGEASNDPEKFLPFLEWLTGGDAHAGFAFGHKLGMLDKAERWKGPILSQWTAEAKDHRFIGGYFKGVLERVGDDIFEQQLDVWADTPGLRTLVAVLTWRCLATPQSADRLGRLISDGHVPPGFLGNLVYGYWARDLPLSSVERLVDAAASTQDRDSGAASLGFIEQYLETHSDCQFYLKDRAIRALQSCIGVKLNVMDEHYWSQLAERYVSVDPATMAALAVETIRRQPDDSYSSRDEVVRVLGMALGRGGWPLFEETVAPALIEEPILTIRLGGLEGAPAWFPRDEPSGAIEWAERDARSRLSILLRFTPVHGTPLPELTRRILIRWGDDRAVRSSLSGRFISGTWMGSSVTRLRGLRQEASSWLGDTEPNVREWATELVRVIEADIHREVREEEEDLLP